MILVYSGWHAREIHSWLSSKHWTWNLSRMILSWIASGCFMALGFISTFGIATLVTWCDWWTVELGSWSLVRWNLGLAYTSMLGIKRVSQYVMRPIPSMYGIFAYIWLIFMVNVGKYAIHGSYGVCHEASMFHLVSFDSACQFLQFDPIPFYPMLRKKDEQWGLKMIAFGGKYIECPWVCSKRVILKGMRGVLSCLAMCDYEWYRIAVMEGTKKHSQIWHVEKPMIL